LGRSATGKKKSDNTNVVIVRIISSFKIRVFEKYFPPKCTLYPSRLQDSKIQTTKISVAPRVFSNKAQLTFWSRNYFLKFSTPAYKV